MNGNSNLSINVSHSGSISDIFLRKGVRQVKKILTVKPLRLHVRSVHDLWTKNGETKEEYVDIERR